MRHPLALAVALAALELAAVSGAQAQTLAALCQDREVRFLDGQSGKILATESAGAAPGAMLVPPHAYQLYVAQSGTAEESQASVRMLGIITGRFEYALPLSDCEAPSSLAAGPPRRVYVTCEQSDELLELYTTTSTLEKRHRVGPGMVAAAYHANSSTIALLDRRGEAIVVYHPESRQFVRRLGGVRAPRALEPDPEGILFAVLSGGRDGQDGEVRLFDPEARSLRRPIVVGPDPRAVRFAGSSAMALVTTAGAKGLALVDLERAKVAQRLDVGPRASGLAVDAAGRRAWVSSEAGNTVVLVDLERWTVEQTFSVPGGPSQLVLVRE